MVDRTKRILPNSTKKYLVDSTRRTASIEIPLLDTVMTPTAPDSIMTVLDSAKIARTIRRGKLKQSEAKSETMFQMLQIARVYQNVIAHGLCPARRLFECRKVLKEFERRKSLVISCRLRTFWPFWESSDSGLEVLYCSLLEVLLNVLDVLF